MGYGLSPHPGIGTERRPIAARKYVVKLLTTAPTAGQHQLVLYRNALR